MTDDRVVELRQRLAALRARQPPVVEETSSVEPRRLQPAAEAGEWVSLPASDHDHFGHMEYGPERLRCGGCGQVWRLARRDNGDPVGWEPEPYRGPSYGRTSRGRGGDSGWSGRGGSGRRGSSGRSGDRRRGGWSVA